MPAPEYVYRNSLSLNPALHINERTTHRTIDIHSNTLDHKIISTAFGDVDSLGAQFITVPPISTILTGKKGRYDIFAADRYHPGSYSDTTLCTLRKDSGITVTDLVAAARALHASVEYYLAQNSEPTQEGLTAWASFWAFCEGAAFGG